MDRNILFFKTGVSMYDAIVIGSGVSGASVARELSRYKLKIAVLEKGDDVCSGTSKGNSAVVHSGYDARYGTNKAHYNVIGNAMYDNLCHELSVPFVRNGTITYALSEEEVEKLQELTENAKKNKVPGVKLLNRKELEEVGGDFGAEVCGGLWAPTGGVVCPYNLVIAMCENAAENGVEFFLNTEVNHIEKEAIGYSIKTNRGEFISKIVFNCAGTHADEMNNFVSSEKLKIIPRKGNYLILDRKLSGKVKNTIFQAPKKLPGGGHTKGMVMVPTVDGTIILGCDSTDVDDKDDVSTTREGIEAVYQYFSENWKNFPVSREIPEFPKKMIISSYAGLRAHSVTDDFIIGEVKDAEGFFNMAGIESPGLTAAPAIAAELVSEVSKKYIFEINPAFNPLRKIPKQFRDMNDEERIKALERDKNYGKIICRCEEVTKAEILQAINSIIPAKSVNAIKMRTRAGMGRCQGGYCGPEIVSIISEETGIPITEITLSGEDSFIVPYETCIPGEI
ncbi:MAG: NAD(P)/FAD-dependent oxidoreductase [Ruminococcaceae bacterium]|nr:NAD(P)/FAD-dependent oxidoreductase [Oscillospiraceae bacterium]